MGWDCGWNLAASPITFEVGCRCTTWAARMSNRVNRSNHRNLVRRGERIYYERQVDGHRWSRSLGTSSWEEAEKKRDALERKHGIKGLTGRRRLPRRPKGTRYRHLHMRVERGSTRLKGVGPALGALLAASGLDGASRDAEAPERSRLPRPWAPTARRSCRVDRRGQHGAALREPELVGRERPGGNVDPEIT